MEIVFYVSAALAVLATGLALTRRHAVHALLYLILSLLAVALVFFALGAPFVAALEIIVYAGAIMVLFLFVVMMLNPGGEAREPGPRFGWETAGAAAITLGLAAELAYILLRGGAGSTGAAVIDPVQVGVTLLGPYVLGVELASILLLTGLVAAYHLGRGEAGAEESGKEEM